MVDFADVRARARPREQTVALCLRGDLVAEWETLNRRLEELDRTGWQPGSLEDADPAVAVAERMAALREEMLADTVEFRFRALPASGWRAWEDAHPPRDGVKERYDMVAGPPALIAASAVDPRMTPAEVADLFEVISEGQRDALFLGAWEVNTGRAEVPFSLRASVLTRRPG